MNPTMKRLSVKVAGVTYEGRQSILARLTGAEPCKIVPEPDNPHDPNALAVHVALSDGSLAHVGYVPRDLAKEIAPHLDGEAVMARIADLTGGFELWNGDTANLGLVLAVEVPVNPDHDIPF